MCNTFSITSNVEAIQRLFRVERNAVGNMPALPGVFPEHDAPVVRIAEDGVRELANLRWGFLLPQPGKAPKAVTNARADKIAVSPFWKASFVERRCLIPTTSFCEWTDARDPATKRKTPVWFGMTGDGLEARPLFAMAGLWRRWRGMLKDQLVDLSVVTVVTTAANDVVRPVYAKAMPVIVAPEQYDLWLAGDPDEALRLAVPYPAEAMAVVARGVREDDPFALALG